MNAKGEKCLVCGVVFYSKGGIPKPERAVYVRDNVPRATWRRIGSLCGLCSYDVDHAKEAK